jgi:hypothetical protein
MKKLILCASLITFVSLPSFAWVKIVKVNGGLFGYKYITEEHTGGNHSLGCNEPGRQKCRFSQISQGRDNVNKDLALLRMLNVQVLDEIEEKINGLIKSGSSLNGNFRGINNIYVKYDYDAESNILSMEIYSEEEATELGL